MFKTCSQKWDNLVFQNEMRNMSSAFRVYRWLPSSASDCARSKVGLLLLLLLLLGLLSLSRLGYTKCQ